MVVFFLFPDEVSFCQAATHANDTVVLFQEGMMSQELQIVKSRVVLGALLGLSLSVTACGEEKPPAVPVTPVPTTTATATVAPPPPPPPQPQSGACDSVMTAALQTAIQARSKQELSWGMKAEGAFACETVAQGGSAKVAANLQPGRCYTFVAESYPNVTELDIFLKPNLGPTPPPLLAAIAGTVLAQDSDNGPRATVGRGKNCYKWPFPLPAAVVVEATARTGAGPVAVQVYSR